MVIPGYGGSAVTGVVPPATGTAITVAPAKLLPEGSSTVTESVLPASASTAS